MSSEEVEEVRVGEVQGNSQTCMFCKFALGQLEKMIEDKHNEEEIKEGLEKLCGYLPKNYAEQCKTFVDTYTEIIINMLVQDATPEEVTFSGHRGFCNKPVSLSIDHTLNRNTTKFYGHAYTGQNIQ